MTYRMRDGVYAGRGVRSRIGRLMGVSRRMGSMKIHDKIYLQIGGNADVPIEGPTWCEDRINNDDVEYIRADSDNCTCMLDELKHCCPLFKDGKCVL